MSSFSTLSVVNTLHNIVPASVWFLRRVIFHYTCLGGPPIEMIVPTQGSLADSFVLAGPLLRLLITFLVFLDRSRALSLALNAD